MTAATAIANTVPENPAGAPSRGLGRALEASTLSGAQGFATTFQSALTLETPAPRPERTRSSRESRGPLSRSAQDLVSAAPGAASAPDAPPSKARPTRTESSRPEPARASSTKDPAPKPDPARAEPSSNTDANSARAARTASANDTPSKDAASKKISSSTANDAPAEAAPADERPVAERNDVATAVAVAAWSAPVTEPASPELFWGDLDGARLATDETAPAEDLLETGAVDESAGQQSLLAANPSEIAPPSLPTAPRMALAPEPGQEAGSALEGDQEPPSSTLEASDSLAVLPDHPSATAPPVAALPVVPVAPTPLPTAPVAPAADAPATPLSDRPALAHRGLHDREPGHLPEGLALPDAAQFTAASSKNPVAFTMQLKAVEPTAPVTTETASPTVMPAAVAAVPAITPAESGPATDLGASPNPNAENNTPALGPVKVATTNSGSSSDQESRHGQDRHQDSPAPETAVPSEAAPVAAGKPLPAAPTNVAATLRSEGMAAPRGVGATRPVTATEAVADAAGTRAEQVRNLPRPVGPQRLALRVDPPPVSGTQAAPAPGRAVELYLEQRGADVHFAVRSADASLVSDLQGSVKELSNRLEQAGFRTESYLPSDTVRGAGQTQSSNNSGFRDEEPSQRQPGENPQNPGGQQSGGRDSRQNREGQQPRWRNEFEEMFSINAPASTVAAADR